MALGSGIQHAQRRNKRNCSSTLLWLLGLVAALLLVRSWLLPDAFEYAHDNNHETYRPRQTPSSTTATFESDFIPPYCHDYLVKDFPSLTTLIQERKDAAMGAEGGAWSACTHLQRYGMNFMPFLARHLAFGLQPKSVLEFGCGLGTLSDFLARFVPGGSEVVCVEPEPMLGEVFAHNKPFPYRPLQLAMYSFADKTASCSDALFSQSMGFELVVSLEVAEHVPSEYTPQLIRRLTTATSKYLVFAAARPGQGGTGHIDESSHDREWWIQQFTKTGKLRYLPQLTLNMRWLTARPERAYDLGKNIIAFGALGVEDVPEVPKLAHACFWNPTILNGNRTSDTDIETELAKQQGMDATIDIPKCPAQDQTIRKRWVEGQQQALWPELDLLERRVKSGQLKC